MKVIKLLAFFITLTFAIKGVAQSHSDGLVVKMDGYLINLGGLKLFQPCEDSTKSVFAALDNRSFILSIDNINDLYFDAIDNIGDSMLVSTYDTTVKEKVYEKFSFFHCTLEVTMFFLDARRFKIFKEPFYTIYYNEKQYFLRGFDVENRVKRIIPSNRNNLMMMYQYYINKGYNAPAWLSKIVSGNAAK